MLGVNTSDETSTCTALEIPRLATCSIIDVSVRYIICRYLIFRCEGATSRCCSLCSLVSRNYKHSAVFKFYTGVFGGLRGPPFSRRQTLSVLSSSSSVCVRDKDKLPNEFSAEILMTS